MKWFMAILITFVILWTAEQAMSGKTKEKTIECDDKKSKTVRVVFGRVTVLNFPFKPSDVIPGKMNFDFKRIKNDLIITALRPGSKTNAIVYLEGRRCSFDLITVSSSGDDILTVQDPKDSRYEVNFE
ncbi:MAG TPA: hypothetical protein VIG33_04925 [Pseudobdellovibrionaceae bacterium]